MGVRFECRSRVDAPIAKVFDLAISIDAHLDSMTRHHERAIAGVTRGQIGLGEVVTWRARHFGVPWTMTSRIVELERPTSFVDEQVQGPFARYRHEHRFISVDGGTEPSMSCPLRSPSDSSEGSPKGPCVSIYTV